MIGNPHRKRRKSGRKARRSSRRSRALRLNPGGALAQVWAAPREMATADFAKDAASVAVGFILPNMLVAKLPANLRDSRVKVYASKIVTVAVVSAVSGMVSKRASRLVLLGGGVSVLLDLWVDFIAPALGQGAAPAPSTGVYYGQSDSGMSVYYGESVGSLAESFA